MYRRACVAFTFLSMFCFGCSDDGGGATDAGADTGETDTGITDDAGVTDVAPDAETDVPVGEPLDLDAWCEQSVGELCDFIYTCLSADELLEAEELFRFSNEPACNSGFGAGCRTRTIGGVEAGRQAYDGATAAACVAALQEEPCGTLQELQDNEVLNPPICEGVTIGLQGPGDACDTDSDCSEPAAQCVEGVCTDSLGADAFMTECTLDRADDCAGLRCLELPENSQAWTGICTATCSFDEECGPGAGCFATPQSEVPLCLALCDGVSECDNGLSCVQLTPTRAACMVELLGEE